MVVKSVSRVFHAGTAGGSVRSEHAEEAASTWDGLWSAGVFRTGRVRVSVSPTYKQRAERRLVRSGSFGRHCSSSSVVCSLIASSSAAMSDDSGRLRRVARAISASSLTTKARVFASCPLSAVLTPSFPARQALGFVLCATYLGNVLFPSSVERLALVPDKVVPRCWTLFTSSFYEWNGMALCFNLAAQFFIGQRLERVWGAQARTAQRFQTPSTLSHAN